MNFAVFAGLFESSELGYSDLGCCDDNRSAAAAAAAADAVSAEGYIKARRRERRAPVRTSGSALLTFLLKNML